jgi:hypothetical protein
MTCHVTFYTIVNMLLLLLLCTIEALKSILDKTNNLEHFSLSRVCKLLLKLQV